MHITCPRVAALAAVCTLIAACSDVDALASEELQQASPSASASTDAATPDSEPAKRTGSPALPLPGKADAPIESEARIVSLDDVQRGERDACQIKFTYPDYPAQDVLWFDEPCAALSVSFMDREQLQEFDKWKRIDEYGQEQIMQHTAGLVLYVEGQFTASVFPMDYNHAPIEVSVAD